MLNLKHVNSFTEKLSSVNLMHKRQIGMLPKTIWPLSNSTRTHLVTRTTKPEFAMTTKGPSPPTTTSSMATMSTRPELLMKTRPPLTTNRLPNNKSTVAYIWVRFTVSRISDLKFGILCQE